MNILESLPVETRSVLPSLSRSKGVSLLSRCDEIREQNLSDHQNNVLVVWLLKNWYATKSNSCQKYGVNAPMNVDDVVMIIERLHLQREFSQILLLLPERRKRKLLCELCLHLKERNGDHELLKREMFLHASTDYIQNFMTQIDTANICTVDIFFENLCNILECTTDVNLNRCPGAFLVLLDSLLLDIPTLKNNNTEALELNKNGNNRAQNPSLLNTSDRFLVKQMKEQCQKGRAYSVSNNTQQHVQFINKISTMESWKRLVNKCVAFLKADFDEESSENVKLTSESMDLLTGGCFVEESPENFESEDLIVNVAMKTKCLYEYLNINKSDDQEVLLHNLEEIMQLFSEQHAQNDLLVYVCERSTSIDDVIDLHKTSLNQNVLFTIWTSEEDLNRKFSLSLKMINNLFNGHENVFNWLLELSRLSLKQSDAFIDSVSKYAIEYGTPSTVLLFIHKTHQCDQQMIKDAFKKISLRCVDCLSSRALNTIVIPGCQQYYTDMNSMFNERHHAADNSVKIMKMNQLLNKMVDSSSDGEENRSMFHLSTFCFQSPFVLLQEMFERVFNGQLKYTVVIKLFTVLPSVLKLRLFHRNEKVVMTTMMLLKATYIANKDVSNCSNKFVLVLTNLCKCGTREQQLETMETLIEEFVCANLFVATPLSSGTFMEMSSTLQLLSELLACHPHAIPYVQLTFLLEVLLPLLVVSDTETDVEVAENFEAINSCVKNVVKLLEDMIEGFDAPQRELSLCYVKELMDEHSWLVQFYFKHFCSSAVQTISEHHQQTIKLPQPLFKFLSPEKKPDSWHSFVDDRYSNLVYGHWMALFELYTISSDHGDCLALSVPVVLIDEEIDGIIQAVVKIFFNTVVNKYKMLSILYCLQQLVEYNKLQGIETYFPESLQNEKTVNSRCFAVLILTQTMTSMIDDALSNDHNEIDYRSFQTFPKIFNSFIVFAKELKDHPRAQNEYCIYILELIVYAVTMFEDDVIAKCFSLFLMDMLMIILNSFTSLPSIQFDKNVKKCGEILDSCRTIDSFAELKLKYDAFLKLSVKPQ